MRISNCLAIALLCVAVPSQAATVTIEQVMKVNASVSPATSTPGVPGRAANIVFRGDNPIPPPAVNDAGAFVFRARSALNTDTNNSAAFGLYAKRPGFPLAVLVDTTEISAGVPTFSVPGRPANNRFTSFRPPIMNNAGDVVFQAAFTSPGTTPSSGTGIYAVKVTGGPIVKVADTFTAVPSYPTAVFNSFDPGLASVAFTTVVNDMGQIAYWGQFLIPGNSTQRSGLFGATVAGGAGLRLADSVGASGPVSVPIGTNDFFNEIRYVPAMNNSGTVVFSAGMPGGSTNRGGVYVVSVTGGPISTVAIRGQAVPGRAGQTFQDTFEPGGHNVDINDAGVILFRNQYQLSSPLDTGAYSAVGSGSGFVHTRIFDTGPGLTIPGEPAGAEFSGFSLPGINGSSVISPYSRVSPGSPTPNQQGIYYTDSDGNPFSVVANLNTAPPGQSPPVAGFPRFTGFDQSNGALGALNGTGNLTFLGVGNPTASTSFRGIYFYDVCTPELFRISDSTISSAQLGGVVNNGYDIWQVESHAGMYRSINNLNDVAFAAQFTNFDYGLYIAHITTGSGGQINITCPPDVVAECPADGSVAGNGTASASGCGTITVSSSDVSVAGCGASETITRTWTADNGSTTATCVQTITEIDTTGPMLSGVPDKASAECGAVPAPAVVTATDACDGQVPVVLSESSSDGPCPGAFIITRTWIATDNCGNSTEASHSICVIDTLDPMLMGTPGDVTVECDSVPPAAAPTSSDTCDTMPTITFSEVRTNGACDNQYSLNRTWTATDDCGNDVSATQIVTVDDTTPPSITCPASTSQECPADTSVGFNGTASGADNCGAVTISSSDASVAGCGATETITRTWTATDACQNPVSCDQLIAVVDTTPPTLSGVPANASAECDAVPPAASPSASDACDPNVPVTLSELRTDGTCPGNYTLSRTWTASDGCGNLATAAQTLSVQDTTSPVITCPASATLQCPADTSAAAMGTATATDNCGSVTVSSSDATVPGCGATQSITRTWSANDACGHTSTCGQTLNIVDTTPPTLSGVPANVSVECNAVPAPASPTAADSCDPSVDVTYDQIRVDGTCPAAYTLSRTWTATDDCGNLASASQTVLVQDSVPPVIAVNTAPIVVVDQNCSGSECVQIPTATATDGCDSDVTVQHDAPLCGPSDSPNPDSGDDDCGYHSNHGSHHGQHGNHDDNPSGTCSGFCFPTGTSTVTYTAMDDCGNTSTATKTVTVKYGANIAVRVDRYNIGNGSHPQTSKQPLPDIDACAYDRSNGSCGKIVCGGHSRPQFECILEHCDPVACCTTDSSGRCTINLPPDDYVVIADDVVNDELPDPLAVNVDHLSCHETENAYLQQIVHSNGHKKPCKFTRLTGSELLVIEPEFIVWDETVQDYPFVFETIGDWSVTATVSPPEGFVADYDSLSAQVDDDLKSVQFVITEVGSDLVPTKTRFDILHKGERKTVQSDVGILLTPEYAKSRGFDVNGLKSRGLIVEPQKRQRDKQNSHRAGSR